MADWQGPALCVYNNATFSSRDFNNLVKIGQASKLDRLVTTGRFGLGFNSVYHFTDCPTLVSGDSVVTFDPHVNFLPGATPSQPGIKIKFTNDQKVNNNNKNNKLNKSSHNAKLKEHFPDQFNPLCFFGCDLNEYFDGTLFRFPLRTKALAQQSEISKAYYDDPSSVYELIASFRRTAERFLLFLRNVAHIEVLILDDQCIGDEPRSLFTVGVERSPLKQYRISSKNHQQLAHRNAGGGDWNAIQDFITDPDPQAPLSKDRFYQRLANTPVNDLPQVEQMVKITFTEHAILQTNSKDKLLSQYNDHDVHDHEDVSVNKLKQEQVDEFMVVACLGGGDAQKMAIDIKNQAMKFIPWGGVAAHLRRNGKSTLLNTENRKNHNQDKNNIKFVEGKAFCFLPLPVGTGMPVHINGYFELSSNRRDIWFGQDMAGDGKRRSEWNSVLLSDAIGPAYSRLLAAAARDFGDTDPKLYYSLWPTTPPSEPWRTAYKALFRGTKDLPVLFTTYDGGSWIPASKAIVIGKDYSDESKVIDIDDNEDEHNVDVHNQINDDTTVVADGKMSLENILLSEGLPVVMVPQDLQTALVTENAVHAEAGPKFIRDHFSKPIQHPCIDMNYHSSSSSTDRNVGHKHALFLLSIASSDVNIQSRLSDVTRFDVLENLPFIPLGNHSMGTFQKRYLPKTYYESDNSIDESDDDEDVADLDTSEEVNRSIDHIRFIVNNEHEKQLLSSIPEKLVCIDSFDNDFDNDNINKQGVDFEKNVKEEGQSHAYKIIENGRKVLQQIADCGRLNVLKLTPLHLCTLLELLLPGDWSPNNLDNLGLDQVPWVTIDSVPSSSQTKALEGRRNNQNSKSRSTSSRIPPPNEEWVIHFWRYISAQDTEQGGGGSVVGSRGIGIKPFGTGKVPLTLGVSTHNTTSSSLSSSSFGRYECFVNKWPLLPCFHGGNGRRVLRRLNPINQLKTQDNNSTLVAVVNPRRCENLGNSMKDVLSPELCECLALIGVAVIDTQLLGDIASSSILNLFAEPPTARGILNALFAPYKLNPINNGVHNENVVSDDIINRLKIRFQNLDSKYRDCLREFLKDPQSSQNESQGKLPYELLYLIKALPIFPVFASFTKNVIPTYQSLQPMNIIKKNKAKSKVGKEAINIFSKKWLPPDDDLHPLLFEHCFIKCENSRERQFVEHLGISRLSLSHFFLFFILPRLDPNCDILSIDDDQMDNNNDDDDDVDDEDNNDDEYNEDDHVTFLNTSDIITLFNRNEYNEISLPEDLYREVGLRFLDDYPKLMKQQHVGSLLKQCAIQCKFIPDGFGDLRKAYELYDPTDRDLLALLSEDKFPDRDHSTPSTLASLKSLGLQTSLTCEGVLVSARSVELMSESGEKSDKNASIAIRRGSDLLKFLDFHLDDLIKLTKRKYNFGVEEELIYQKELSIAREELLQKHSKPLVFQKKKTMKKTGHKKNKKNNEDQDQDQNPLSQAAAEHLNDSDEDDDADGGFNLDIEDEDENDELAMYYAKEAAKKEEMELKIFEEEWALKPSWVKPWREFVTELTNISWMPVHRKKESITNSLMLNESSSSLLPWPKNGWSPVLIPLRVRPKEDAWICSYTFGLSLHEVRSDLLREALGWNDPIKPGAVASQVLLLAKSYGNIFSSLLTTTTNTNNSTNNNNNNNNNQWIFVR